MYDGTNESDSLAEAAANARRSPRRIVQPAAAGRQWVSVTAALLIAVVAFVLYLAWPIGNRDVPVNQNPLQPTPPQRVAPPAKAPLYDGEPASYWIKLLEDRNYETRRTAALALVEISPDG